MLPGLLQLLQLWVEQQPAEVGVATYLLLFTFQTLTWYKMGVTCNLVGPEDDNVHTPRLYLLLFCGVRLPFTLAGYMCVLSRSPMLSGCSLDLQTGPSLVYTFGLNFRFCT